MLHHADEILLALRRRVAAMEAQGAGRPAGRGLALGIGALDRMLGGGFALGALHEITPAAPSDFGAAVSFALALLARERRALDLLSLGEEPARFLGADVEPLKRRLYLVASLLTAAAVAVSGIIGFVGLVVPHAVRVLAGSTHGRLLPAAFLLGGALLAAADAMARTAFAPQSLPVGVVTALVGVPAFAVLVRRWAS